MPGNYLENRNILIFVIHFSLETCLLENWFQMETISIFLAFWQKFLYVQPITYYQICIHRGDQSPALSKTHYDWRKIEPVSMKANFIQFWCVESESIVKNEFHNWTSELGCIWHIFGKFGSFQALQHWQQPAAANKLSLVDSDVDSYLNIRIFQKEPKIA